MIGRSNREIALSKSRPVSEVVFCPAGVPAPFFGVDVIEPILLALIEAHTIEDEELSLGTEVCCVSDSARGQVRLRLAGNKPRVAIVGLLGYWINHVAYQNQRGHFGERVEKIAVRVRYEQHVALMDTRPCADGGSVNTESFVKTGFRELL